MRQSKQKQVTRACIALLKQEGVWVFPQRPKLDVIFSMSERALNLEIWPEHKSRAKRVARLSRAFGLNEAANANKAQKRKKADPEFYATREWRTLRYKVLVKANGSCMACGRSKAVHNVVLHVDHIKPRFHFPELELEESNLQVLCEDCNLGKGAWDQTDWR